MARKDIVKATNFRLSKIAGQSCLVAEIRIRCLVPYEPNFERKLQETLDTRTSESWPITLDVWNDYIYEAIEQIAAQINTLSEPELQTQRVDIDRRKG